MRALHDNHRLLLGDFLFLLVDQIFQRNGIKIIDHLCIQRCPQVVGHAARAVMLALAVAVFLAAALGRINRFINCGDDIGYRDVFCATRSCLSARLRYSTAS